MRDRISQGPARRTSPGGLKIVFGGAGPLARQLRRALAPHFDVAGAARRGERLLALALRLKPQVIVLETQLSGLESTRAARRLRAELPETKLIFLGIRAAPEAVNEAVAAGASGFVPADTSVDELIHAIEAVLRGQLYLPSVRDAAPAPPPPSSLTPRQRQVLELIAAGLSNKETAHRLRISIKTVEFHKANLMARLHLHTTADLVKYAVRHGLTQA